MFACYIRHQSRLLSSIASSAGLGQALVRSGWMMLAVLGVNHASSPAQTEELGLTTVATLKMWPFIALVLVPLVPTAALLTVSFCICCWSRRQCPSGVCPFCQD